MVIRNITYSITHINNFGSCILLKIFLFLIFHKLSKVKKKEKTFFFINLLNFPIRFYSFFIIPFDIQNHLLIFYRKII